MYKPFNVKETRKTRTNVTFQMFYMFVIKSLQLFTKKLNKSLIQYLFSVTLSEDLISIYIGPSLD